MGFWQNLFGGRGSGQPVGDEERHRLQHQLESQAHSVSLRRLRSYGLQSVRVIDATTIQGIVNSALNEALRLRGVPITPKEREEIESLARAQLESLMDENRRLTSAKDEVERRQVEAARKREEFELSIAVLRKELEDRQKELQAERARLGGAVGADGALIPPLPGARPSEGGSGMGFLEWGSGIRPGVGSGVGVVEPKDGEAAPPRPRFVHADGEGASGVGTAEGPPVKVVAEFGDDQFSKMESRLQLVFQRLVRDRELFQKNDGGEWIPHLESLEREVREVLTKLVAEAKAAAGAEGGGEKVEFLEKRIGKLNEALAVAEANLAKLARLKGIDPGIASLVDGIEGLNSDDPNFARKSELLTQVFNENLELQGKPVGGPSAPSAPVASAAPSIAAVPSSFEAPVDVSGEAAF